MAALVAAAAIVVAALCGAHDAVLHVLPLLALGTALVSGRYVGERRILSLRRARAGQRLRLALTLAWAVPERVVVAACLARSPRTLRGPPTPA